jgi:DNA (cytosine-5)-methyltransferase 1
VSAYYNENDPFLAAWLRNLIAAKLIADGFVDERSIVDVQPSDLKGFAQVHLFAGVGGWPYALRLARWSDDEPVWTGSCPCQPLSIIGLRKGHTDRRHLWPAFHCLIAQRRPPIVFGEQIAGGDGLEWLGGVRADLEDRGYAVGAANLCAAGQGAPHDRDRLYFVANANAQHVATRQRREHHRHETGRDARDDFNAIRRTPNFWSDFATLDERRWLMGFPPAWLNCTPSATPSSRKSPRSSSSPRA